MVKDVINLGSGSKGNAYFLMIETESTYAFWEGSKPFGLLIECGLTFDVLSMRLREQSKGKYSMVDVNAVLVTHRHHDHSLSVKDLMLLGKKVYAPLQVFEHWEIDINSREYKGLAIPLQEGLMKHISPDIYVTPFEVEHDEKKNMLFSNRELLTKVIDYDENAFIKVFGYIITLSGKYNILFFIDTMFMPYNFDVMGYQFNMIFGEANHFSQPTYFAYENAKKEMNYANIKRYERLIYSHMNIETFVKTLNGLDLSKTTHIFAMHTSSSERVTGDEIKYYYHIKNNLKPLHRKDLKILVCKEHGNYATGGI